MTDDAKPRYTHDMTGFKHSEESLRKRRETIAKRKAEGMYDKDRTPMTDEHRANLSKARVGKKHSQETKDKIRASAQRIHDRNKA